MRAVEIAAVGGPEMLRPAWRPVPEPGPGEVLVRVAAAGVNRVDAFQRSGLYAPTGEATDIPGVEIAGRVEALGPGVVSLRVGERVCGIAAGGGYAQYCVAHEGQLLPVPAGYDDVRAAALPETFFTVWAALCDHGKLAKGETVLVHGGSSGIGTTAIMLARALGAGAIFTTAGHADKCAACVALGATRAINYRTEDFVEVVKAETGGRGVDVILDIVAGPYVPKNIALMADDARLVFVGRMSQDLAFSANVQRIMYARLVITGLSLRGQSAARKSAIADRLRSVVWPLLDAGAMSPVVDSVLPLENAAEAHRRLEASDHIGKIILSVEAR